MKKSTVLISSLRGLFLSGLLAGLASQASAADLKGFYVGANIGSVRVLEPALPGDGRNVLGIMGGYTLYKGFLGTKFDLSVEGAYTMLGTDYNSSKDASDNNHSNSALSGVVVASYPVVSKVEVLAVAGSAIMNSKLSCTNCNNYDHTNLALVLGWGARYAFTPAFGVNVKSTTYYNLEGAKTKYNGSYGASDISRLTAGVDYRF